MKKEDVYISLIGYGREHLADGVSLEEAKRFLSDSEIDFHEGALCGMFPRIYFVPGASDNAPINYEAVTGSDEGVKRFLRLEAYFNLLEYEELNEARQQAKTATWLAIIAIVISGLLAFISIGFSLYQVTHASNVFVENMGDIEKSLND